ncbi:MAG TPA: class I SAM-dependent methyltransferase, partial [candidate division Zixibacteria bacterium]|nr:class I SAM-dependent methyltransferase [candidate division Zixibacteria bacterium]
ACGSGYWTQLLSPVAEQITATDGSEEMLDIAQAKNYLKPNVTFARWDAFELSQMSGVFDAALAGFWLSHVPRRRLHEFFDGLHSRLKPRSVVLLCDNNLVEGMGGEIIHQPDSDDTYKRRTLNDGTRHVIVKNYFTETDLRELLEPYAADITVYMGHWYWYVLYHTR